MVRYILRVLFVFLFVGGLSLNSVEASFVPEVRPGPGVTAQKWLSDYHPPLKGTNFDTPIFFLDGAKKGATVLLVGGTHPREIGPYTAAVVAIENAAVKEGRLIVIPALNASGYGISDLSTKIPRAHEIKGRSGSRTLYYGDRRVALEDWGKPDDKKFIHMSGFEIDDPQEARNLNRNYPGRPDGSWAEQVTFAVMELIRKENVNMNLDMHEADTPEFRNDPITGKYERGGRLAYMLIANPREEVFEAAGDVVLAISEAFNISLKLEASNPTFRGLSHLEIGSATPSWSFLMETPNPGQDLWRKSPDVINDTKYPLKDRAGLQLEVFKRLVDVWNAQNEKRLIMDLPGYNELKEKGVGAFLN